MFAVARKAKPVAPQARGVPSPGAHCGAPSAASRLYLAGPPMLTLGGGARKPGPGVARDALSHPSHAARAADGSGQASAEQIAAPPIVHDVLRSPGQPLDPATRAFMEPRFGYDFSRVRVHRGAAAEESARDLNAHAFTVGHDVVFGAGPFAPEARRRLVAHELSHVVQQGGGGPPPGQAQERDAEAASRAVSTGARAWVQAPSGIGLAAQPASAVAGPEEYVPVTGAPEVKPLPETKPEVLGRKDLDSILATNAKLRGRIESVATELDIDPGLLAAELMAEEGPSIWSGTSGKVPTEKLGLDDWFGKKEKPQLERVIASHPGLGLKYTDLRETGETWDTATEKPGGGLKPRGLLDADKAVAAFGVYMKMQENVLRSAIVGKSAALRGRPIRTLEDLTPEQRFTVLRVGLNAGVGVGINLFLRLAKGGDIPRSGKTTRDKRNASRTAVLHMARAIHLAQAIFGRSPSDYRPPPAPISNKEAAMIFDHPELKKLPDYVVPFDY
jgi:hypothetical protein